MSLLIDETHPRQHDRGLRRIAPTGIARRDLLKAAGFAALSWNALAKRAMAAANSSQLWGVNLAGAEFGDLIGKHGTQYLYPPPENIAYYARLGFTLVRIPFKWERLQPRLNTGFAEAELQLLTGVVDHARQLGLTTVLDPHNYAKRRVPSDHWKSEYPIGSAEVPLAAFVDFWGRLADHFKTDDKVVLGLMNEPMGLPAAQWLEIANAAIAAIRSAGAQNMIFVPGTDYTGAHSWFTAGNTVMAGVKDPAGNFALEVHQYFDHDSSGTKPTAVSGTIGSERIEAFQDWARKHGFRAFLGEYTSGSDPVSARALMDLCDEMSANSDVWLGSAAWAGGTWWPADYMFNLEPTKGGQIREQTAIIQSRAKSDAPKLFWAGASPSLYADFARKLTMRTVDPASLLRAGGGQEVSRDARIARDSPPLQPSGIPIGTGSQPLFADGELAALLSLPEFTILIELAALDPQSGDCPLLSSNGALLLRYTAKGVLTTDLGGGLSTLPQPLARANEKRRCALGIRRDTQEVMIGMTGAAPVSGHGIAPLSAGKEPHAIQIGAPSQPGVSGYIRRIVGFPKFLGPDELAANVA